MSSFISKVKEFFTGKPAVKPVEPTVEKIEEPAPLLGVVHPSVAATVVAQIPAEAVKPKTTKLDKVKADAERMQKPAPAAKKPVAKATEKKEAIAKDLAETPVPAKKPAAKKPATPAATKPAAVAAKKPAAKGKKSA